MSWRNFLAALLLPASLAGCGFEPIAATPSGGAIGEQDLALTQLTIDSPDPRFSYRLRQEMLRSVAITPDAAQSMKLVTTIDREGLAIEQDDAVTRLNVVAKTVYTLRDAPDIVSADVDGVIERETPPLVGSTRAVTAVNTTASQFSAGVSNRDAVDRLAVETALRMVTLLRVNRPDADGRQGS